MSDLLEREIKSMVVELVESSPPPHPAGDVLGSPLPPRSGPGRMLIVGAAVLLVGLAGAWIGRSLFPAGDGSALPVMEGGPGPEPAFEPSLYGSEVRLLPPTGDIEPDVFLETLDGEVTAVGQIEGTDLEVFAWHTTDPENGACLQVVGFRARSATCSGAFGDEPREADPLVFPRLDAATEEAIDVVTVWQGPPEAAVVVAEAGDTSVWQRPRGGVVAFTFPPDAPSVVLRAIDADGQTIRVHGVSPGQSVEPPTVVGNVPGWCPVTVPGEEAFAPATEAPEGPPSVYDEVWYGTSDLWTLIHPHGEIDTKRWVAGGDRTFWWSENYSPGDPGEITVSVKQINGSAPSVEVSSELGRGFSPFMLQPTHRSVTMIPIELPEPGCWELTAEYKGATLGYVLWASER